MYLELYVEALQKALQGFLEQSWIGQYFLMCGLWIRVMLGKGNMLLLLLSW